MSTRDDARPRPSEKRPRLLGLRPVSVVSWRDAFATITPIVALSALAIFATLHFVRPAPPRTLVMASGPEKSNFRRYAEQYREILARNGVDLQIVPSHGSAENLDLLATHRVDIALVQSGVRRDAGGTEDLVSLGTLFRQPVTIFYRSAPAPAPAANRRPAARPVAPPAAVPVERLSQLAGRRIAIGHAGSGTHALATTLLAGNGIADGDGTDLVDLEGRAAADALLGGEVDAVFLSGDSASVDLVRELLHAEGIRLFDFEAQGEAYERRYRYLNRFTLPPGAFDLGHNLPAQRITMMAPTVEMLAHADLHPALSDLLVETAQEVHRRGTLMQNPGEFPHAIEHDYPMSADAARYYKSGKGFAYRVLPFWLASLVNRAALVLVPVLIVLLPGLRYAPNLYGWRIRRRLYKHYGELMALERAMLEPMSDDQRRERLLQLDQIEKSVVGTKMPGAFADEAYILRRHLQFVREGLTAARTRDSDEAVVVR